MAGAQEGGGGVTEYQDEQFDALDEIAEVLARYLMQASIVGFILGVIAGAGAALFAAATFR